MKKSISLSFVLVATCFCLIIACQGEKTTEAKSTASTATPVEEEKIDDKFVFADNVYKQNCTSCHEATMSAFIKRDWLHGNTWNQVNKSIKYAHAFVLDADGLKSLPDTAFIKLTDYILGTIEKKRNDESAVEPNYEDIVETENLKFTLDTIARGLEIPWGLAQLPNGDLLISDRNGKFYRQTAGADKQEIQGVPAVRFVGQGGLLDVAIHPDYATNQTIYLSYSKPKGEKEATTALLMAKLAGNKLTNQKIIWEALPYHGTRNHYGSRIEFDNEGYLFVTIGDRQRRDENPQDLSRYPGKVHRLNADGSIPADNPFVNTPNAVPSIWSYGHRNPQGLVFDKATGIMWETEHAPRGGDEVNIVKKGLNYGWPVISYGINYNGTIFTTETHKDGMEQPIYYYLPSTGTCGLTLVTGDKYPGWTGDLLAGSLRYRFLSRLKIEGNKVLGEERLLQNIGRLRSVIMGSDGYIYFGVENPGYVFRIMPVQEAI